MKKSSAEANFQKLYRAYKALSDCIEEVDKHGSYAQSQDFRKLGSEIMGRLIVDFFMPILEEYPHLEPAELKGGKYVLPKPLPEAVGGKILCVISELESHLEQLTKQDLLVEDPDEATHYRQGSERLMNDIRMARDFVSRATAVPIMPRSC